MDINAGTILDGTETVEQVGRRIYDKILAVAGGEKTKSELAGMGDEEFAPVRNGLHEQLLAWLQEIGDPLPEQVPLLPPAGTVIATGNPGP